MLKEETLQEIFIFFFISINVSIPAAQGAAAGSCS